MFTTVGSTNNWRGIVSRRSDRKLIVLALAPFKHAFPSNFGYRCCLWKLNCFFSGIFFFILHTDLIFLPVEGPWITNVEKSNLSWQMFSLQGQILILHWPTSVLSEIKYVQFSDDTPPQVS